MTLKDLIETFISSDLKEMEILTENPNSTSVILYRYLKRRREFLGDFVHFISIKKKAKSLLLQKYEISSELENEVMVTLKNGTKVPLKEVI